MPSYEISYYDTDNDRVGEVEDIEAADLSAALVQAANNLELLQGNAHVISVTVELIEDEPGIE